MQEEPQPGWNHPGPLPWSPINRFKFGFTTTTKLGFFLYFLEICVSFFFFLGRKKREDSATSKNNTPFMNLVFLFISEQTTGIFIHLYKHSPLQTNTAMRSTHSSGRGAVSSDKSLETVEPHISSLDSWRIPGRRSHSWAPAPKFFTSSQGTAWTRTRQPVQCHVIHSIPKEPSRIGGFNSQLKSLFKAKPLAFSDLSLFRFLFITWGFSFSWNHGMVKGGKDL